MRPAIAPDGGPPSCGRMHLRLAPALGGIEEGLCVLHSCQPELAQARAPFILPPLPYPDDALAPAGSRSSLATGLREPRQFRGAIFAERCAAKYFLRRLARG